MPPPKASTGMQSRMTANPVKPARYRAGKATAEAASSSSSSDDEDDEDTKVDREDEQVARPRRDASSKASSTTAHAGRISSNLKNVDLNQQWKQSEAKERAIREGERRAREIREREAGFVTESESESNSDNEKDSSAVAPRTRQAAQESSEEEESDSETDDSESEEEQPKKLLRPVFIRKDQRSKPPTVSVNTIDSVEAEAEALARRQAQTDALVQEKLERDAIARAAGKKEWDDDDVEEADLCDDTDGLDPELEHAQWVARELSRLKRARQALEEREREIVELERRRALTSEERDREDAELMKQQEDEKKNKGQIGHMQRYHHKGAFFDGDDEKYKELAKRDLMGARYQDQEAAKAALPEYLQVRDVTKIGRKGRTKYKDMRTEDTGRFGDYGRTERRGGGAYGERRNNGPEYADVTDERFRPDSLGMDGPSGANASSLGERKRPYADKNGQDYSKRPKY